jgi:uncharacterized protein YbjT (DUF2867 family)
MSDPHRVLLIGATGLVGRAVMEASIGRNRFRLLALARREVPLPRGVRMEMVLAPVDQWPKVMADLRPDCVICAIGTTIAAQGGDQEAFRAVDHALVLDVARAALAAGARQFVVVSSVGANMGAKNFYLRTKAEMERDLAKLKFRRLDILQPGLLRGQRTGDARPAERLGQMLAPLAPLVLHGKYRRFRPITASHVACAALALCLEKPGGRFVHEYDALERFAGRLEE